MHRIAGVVLAMMMVGSAVPASAAPVAGVGAEQFGFIDWIEMDGAKGTIIGIVGTRFVDTDSGELITAAGVFKGTCKKGNAAGWTIISCTAEGKGHPIPHEDFNVDPTLASATVGLKVGGQSHVGRWTGRGPAPYTAGGVGTDGQYFGAGAGMYRDCKGTGMVFGKKRMTNSWLDWALLEQGAGVALWNGADLDVDFRNGRVFVTKTVRVAS
jgi:hypothetical protein